MHKRHSDVDKTYPALRAAIIGGGFGLEVQAPLIRTHPHINVTAVSTMQRHQLPEHINCCDNPPAHYTNWMEMLDHEKIDLLFVSSIPVHHFEIVKYAIEKGIHVVCEKPFTMNSYESNELLRLSKTNHIKVVVDFEWRYLPARQRVKQLLDKNTIGELLHVEYHISSPQYKKLLLTESGWMGEKKKFGGMLGALGSHMIDCLRWLTRDEIELMNGLVHTHVPYGAGKQRDADDAFFIHGKTKRNSTFSIQLLSGVNHGSGSSLKLFGSLGSITLTNDKTLCLGKTDGQLEEIPIQTSARTPDHLPAGAAPYYPAFYPFLEKVYEYIAFDRLDHDLPTVWDGHRNQEAIDQILVN